MKPVSVQLFSQCLHAPCGTCGFRIKIRVHINIFSIIEKTIAKARTIGFASAKSVSVLQTIVSKRMKSVRIVQTIVWKTLSIAKGIPTIVSAFEKMIGGPQNLFTLPMTVVRTPLTGVKGVLTSVEIDRCWKLFVFNSLVGV